MRKWFPFLFLCVGLYILLQINRQRKEQKNPLRKRISETVSILTWALLAFYLITFLYWLLRSIF